MVNPFPTTVPDQKYIVEQWFPVCDFHIRDICNGYEISTWGRLYDPITGITYPSVDINREWYITVYIHLKSGGTFPIGLHRLMLMVFDPNPNYLNLEVNHKDGIKYHNWIWNLEWCTEAENMHHAFETGLSPKGEDCSYAIITNEQANKIAELLSKGLSPKQIQLQLRDEIPEANIASVAVSIRNGVAWKDVSKNYDMSNAYNYSGRNLFTDDQIHAMCKAFQEHGTGITYKQAMNYAGIYYGDMSQDQLNLMNVMISSLRKKKSYKNICEQYNY